MASLSLWLIFLATLTIHYSAASLSADKCKERGFTKNYVLCSTCKSFEKIQKLNKVVADCKECCTKDAEAQKTYSKAILEVCTCKYKAYPQIKAFIKSDRPGEFKNLEIKHKTGADPIIRVYNSQGNEDIVDISRWDTDSIIDYLKTHLKD